MLESLHNTMVSRDYFDNIIRAMLDTLIVVDRDLRIQAVNPPTCELLAYTEEELVGKPVGIIFAEQEEEIYSVFQFFREPENPGALRTQDTIRNRELTYKTKDGRLIPMLFNASVIRNKTGNIIGVVAGAKDITYLKVAEAELEREKNFSENIIATIPDCVLVVDKDLRIKKANRSFHETFYTDPAEVIGSRMTEILLDRQGRLITELKKLFETRDMADGSKLYYQPPILFAYPVGVIKSQSTESSGGLNGLVFNVTLRGIWSAEEALVLFSDVTEREKLAKEVRKTKNFLENLVQSSPNGIIATDEHGIITFSNEVAKNILGQDIIGTHVSNYYLGGIEEAKKIMRLLTERRRIYDYELQFVSKGATIDVRLSASLMADESGEVIGTLGIFRDVTEKKKIEQEMFQAEKLASIGRLVAEVCHEVLNPVNIISMGAQLISKKKDLPSDIHQMTDMIMEQVDRIKRIMERLLASSRKKEPEKQACSIQEVLENTLGLYEHQMALDNIKVIRDFPPDLPQIEIDKNQLMQVFTNLIANARDAMSTCAEGAAGRPGGGTLTISIRLTAGKWPDTGSPFMEISFKDTGCGISEKDLNKIFDPFFTTKEEGKGTGLGLSICHAIVEAHGGTIRVASTPGKGSTFTIRLPVNLDKDDV